MGGKPVTHADHVVRDEARQREIPLRVYLPASTAPAPIVLFSHGLGGNREGYGVAVGVAEARALPKQRRSSS